MPGIGKSIIAAICLLLLLPAMMLVWAKDLRKSPQYCAACHADTYYSSFSGSSDSLAYQHSQRGVSCQTCHDRTLSESWDEWLTHITGAYTVPLKEREYPMEEVCFDCHTSYKKMIPLTTPERLGSERNPHDGHWGVLECGVCHNMHRDSIDYCAGCHNRVTTAPGWVPAPPSDYKK
jgi:hypothetical protein